MKTIIFTCDRCGKKLVTQVNPQDILGPDIRPSNVMIFWNNDNTYVKTRKVKDLAGSSSESYHADLCNKCTNDIIKFVKAKLQLGKAEEYDY